MTFTPLADAETLVRGWLASQFPTCRVVTELPAKLADNVPVIQVTVIGGSDSFITLDASNVDIDTFDVARGGLSARENARNLAGQVQTALRLHLPGYAAGGGAVQSVSTISKPRWVPFDDTSLRRFVATYRITIHSIPS